MVEHIVTVLDPGLETVCPETNNIVELDSDTTEQSIIFNLDDNLPEEKGGDTLKVIVHAKNPKKYCNLRRMFYEKPTNPNPDVPWSNRNAVHDSKNGNTSTIGLGTHSRPHAEEQEIREEHDDPKVARELIQANRLERKQRLTQERKDRDEYLRLLGGLKKQRERKRIKGKRRSLKY